MGSGEASRPTRTQRCETSEAWKPCFSPFARRPWIPESASLPGFQAPRTQRAPRKGRGGRSEGGVAVQGGATGGMAVCAHAETRILARRARCTTARPGGSAQRARSCHDSFPLGSKPKQRPFGSDTDLLLLDMQTTPPPLALFAGKETEHRVSAARMAATH